MKRCPFCGGNDVQIETAGNYVGLVWSVWCYDCETDGPMGKTEKEAELLWDKRIDKQEE